MLAVTKIADNFQTNHVEEASDTVTYVGSEGLDGNWYVQKIDTSSGTAIGHAGVKNNETITNYATAWAARASLTYGTFLQAF